MKLRVCAFLAVGTCLVAAPAVAQVSGGVKGGLLLSDFHSGGDDPEVQALGRRPSVAVGGFLIAPSPSPMSVQLEVMFSQRGARLEEEDDRVDFRITYVDISGLLRGTFGDGPVRGYLIVGGTMALRRNAEQEFSEEGTVTSNVDIGEQVHDYDLRIVGGIGVELGQLVLEGRYIHGLRNVFVGPEASPAITTLKNRAVEGLVGISF
jgi:hypothetical protein